MRKFFRIVFGSCLGTLMALLGLMFIVSMFSAALLVGGPGNSKKEKISGPSILHLKLDKAIPEKTNNTTAMGVSLKEESYIGLNRMVELIESATDDPKILGIYIDHSFAQLANSRAQTLRDALVTFKQSGKKILAFSNQYAMSQNAYYISSVADSIILHPYGSIDLRGYGTTIPFYKKMLDDLGVHPEVFYAGKFKSATEPLRRNNMSPENRKQIKEYLQPIQNQLVNDISAARNISPQQVNQIMNELLGRNAASALEQNLIDAIMYEDEVFQMWKDILDKPSDAKIPLLSIYKYHDQKPKSDIKVGAGKVAVVFAEGSISNTDEQNGLITPKRYISDLRKIRDDEDIKAVVLRVNSGGGDALVSDRIWREVNLIKEKGIPVVASFSNVAASGGYYIACGANQIMAEPTTITGSIGVFSVLFNLKDMFKSKLGVNFDTVSTNTYANGIMNPVLEMTDPKRKIIQESTDQMYQQFIQRVAEGRNMTVEEVHKIAQGRVWSGIQAKDIGLVDALGGLDESIDLAAELAGLDAYKIVEYPNIKSAREKLLEDLMNGDLFAQKKLDFDAVYDWLELPTGLQQAMESNTPQARCTFDISEMIQ